MQFLAATFAAYDHPVPPGGADPPSPYDPVDAVHAAARYLCASGAATGDLRAALFAYNHSDAYVHNVTTVAAGYAAASTPDTIADTAHAAVNFALAQVGLPYVWGGDGPAAGEVGFDCSGLTHAAYAAAGIHIPRTADTQWQAGPNLPPGTTLEPGDLLFYGTPTHATHVALYIGNNQMVEAPDVGQPVQISSRRAVAYLGATRPASR